MMKKLALLGLLLTITYGYCTDCNLGFIDTKEYNISPVDNKNITLEQALEQDRINSNKKMISFYLLTE